MEEFSIAVYQITTNTCIPHSFWGWGVGAWLRGVLLGSHAVVKLARVLVFPEALSLLRALWLLAELGCLGWQRCENVGV